MIAFLILAHDDPVHVSRLVKALRPHAVFVHLDLKTKYDEQWSEIDAAFVSPRIPVYWSGFSTMSAIQILIGAALDSKIKFDKLVLLSGSCYPIKPLSELEHLIAADGGMNYVSYSPVIGSRHLPSLLFRLHFRDGLLPWRWTARNNFARFSEKAIRRVLERSTRIFKRKWPSTKTPFYGSTWWAITPECARFVLDECCKDANLTRFYRHVWASDEHLIQTIIGNSSFRRTGERPFTDLEVAGTANLHLIDPSLSRWFVYRDFDEIISSGKYFVRKVSTQKSAALLDALDRHCKRDVSVVLNR